VSLSKLAKLSFFIVYRFVQDVLSVRSILFYAACACFAAFDEQVQ